jgi:RimJ/RimL family protein N-acetyltransferase
VDNNTRIYFRAFEPGDIEVFHKFRNNERIYPYITGNIYFVSRERERKWIEDKMLNDGSNIYLSVCMREDDTLIGYTSINNIDWRNRNALWGSIFVDSSCMRRGLSVDIGRELLKLVFEEMPIHRFYSYLLATNIPSMKMVEKLGFTREGTQRSAVYKLDSFQDLVCISMLKPEYDAKYKCN